MEPIETMEYKGHTIELHYDTDPVSPREWDNLGTMACFHRRYNLGDHGHGLNPSNFSGWGAMERWLRNRGAAVILPIYMYDHSGITISTSPFSCPWDSGRLGLIYVNKEKLRKEYGVSRITEKIREKAAKVLQNEVEIYDNYIRGNIYGFITKDANGEVVDSCWGYDDEDYCISEAQGVVDCLVQHDAA